MDSNRIQDVQPKLGIVVNPKSFYERPDPVAGEIRGSICCDCGLTQLFTDNLEEIWQAYEEDGGFETK